MWLTFTSRSVIHTYRVGVIKRLGDLLLHGDVFMISKYVFLSNLRGSLSVFTIMSITENSLRPGIEPGSHH